MRSSCDVLYYNSSWFAIVSDKLSQHKQRTSWGNSPCDINLMRLYVFHTTFFVNMQLFCDINAQLILLRYWRLTENLELPGNWVHLVSQGLNHIQYKIDPRVLRSKSWALQKLSLYYCSFWNISFGPWNLDSQVQPFYPFNK